jgi:7-cyano-7-deazaguanine synthase
MSNQSLAVLISGGLDSAILVGYLLRKRHVVYPIFVRFGLDWEAEELSYLKRYLEAIECPALGSLVVLDQPVADVYGLHWSVTGEGVPDALTPDEAVYLPGRNVMLLAKPMLWCHRKGVPTVALGSLATNPFPDATPSFIAAMEEVMTAALGSRVEVRLPFGGMHKPDVMRLGRDLPLELTFSCIRPVNGRHCGWCNKCAERRHGFAEAGMSDPTEYR